MIKLSTKGRYGTRLMQNLAFHYNNGNESVILKNISDEEEISAAVPTASNKQHVIKNVNRKISLPPRELDFLG